MRSIRAACAAIAMLGAAACGDGSEPPADSAPSGSLAVMSDWIGCEVFDELAPVREYTGAVGTDGELLSDGLGEGIDAEAATCSGLLDLATFEDTQGTFDYSATGDAAVRVGLAPGRPTPRPRPTSPTGSRPAGRTPRASPTPTSARPNRPATGTRAW
ncbi:hypothetical protein GCM10029992_01200 [Glycomyces albus]